MAASRACASSSLSVTLLSITKTLAHNAQKAQLTQYIVVHTLHPAYNYNHIHVQCTRLHNIHTSYLHRCPSAHLNCRLHRMRSQTHCQSEPSTRPIRSVQYRKLSAARNACIFITLNTTLAKNLPCHRPLLPITPPQSSIPHHHLHYHLPLPYQSIPTPEKELLVIGILKHISRFGNISSKRDLAHTFFPP